MSDDAIYTIPKDDLPSMWELKSIHELVGKVGVFVDGDWVESKDQDPNGDVRLIQLADIGDGGYQNKSNRFLTLKRAKELGCTFLQKGDVLIARMPDPLGRACIFPGDAKQSVTVVDVAIVRPGNDSFDTKWLMYFINAPTFRSTVASLEAGSTRKRISRKNLGKIHLPVPPLTQQKRIVAEIDTQFSRLDEAVSLLKRMQSNLKRYKAAILKAAVEGKLTEQWRKDHPDVEPADQLLKRINEKRDKWITKAIKEGQSEPKTIRSKLLKHKFVIPDDVVLPPKWESVSLLSACQMVVDCHNKTAPYEDSGIPLIRTTNVRNGRLLLNGVRYVSEGTYTFWSKRCPPEPGDILFTREAPMGEVTIIPEGAKLCMGQRMMLLRVFDDLVSVKYIFYAMQNPLFQTYMNTVAIGTGVKHLRVGDVESLVIPLPPLYEQNKIVEEIESRLSVTEELEITIGANLKRAKRLRQTVLQKAFSSGFN